VTDQKRAAIKNLIERQTRLKTTSKEIAREFLVREGIYTKDGRLSPRFGGADNGSEPDKPQETRKRA
jgi:hypothetical protein